MFNFNSILLSSENPRALGEFYQGILGLKLTWDDGGYVGMLIGNTALTIGPHDKVSGKNPNPERIILNFETADVEVEFERIRKLGATVVAEPYHPGDDPDMAIATFADPDGNYFQLMTPMSGVT